MTDQQVEQTWKNPLPFKTWLDSVEKIVERVTRQSIEELVEEADLEKGSVLRELLEIYNSKRYHDTVNAADVVLYTVGFDDYRAEVSPSGELILVSTL